MVDQLRSISETELEVLKVLWARGPSTVRQVNETLSHQRRSYAHTTVQTLLARLEAKGHVRCDRSEVAHIFEAVVSRDAMVRRRLKDLADELCEGTATPILQALVDGNRLTPDEIEELRRRLDELSGS